MSHLPNWQEYGIPSGSDKQVEPVDLHDKEYGEYVDVNAAVPTADRLPTAQMPQGKNPSPFVTK